MKNFRTISVGLMLVAGLLLGIHSTALAIPYVQLTLNDGTNQVIIQDGGPLDVNSTVGVVTYSAGVGAGPWTVNTTTGLTYPTDGTPAQPFLDLSSINATSLAGGSLTVVVSAIGYTGPISGGKTGPFVFAAGGTLGPGSVEFSAGYEAGSSLGGPFTPVGSLGPFSTSGAFSGTTTIPAFDGATSPFALDVQAYIVHSGQGTTSFDTNLQAPVPEPATMFLLGAGLIGLAGYGRKKFFKK